MTTETQFIHLLLGWFLTPFCLFFLYAAPTRKCARASHEMAQFMLKIAHLAILMEPTRLLEKVSSYGLLPRIWLLICSKTYCTIRHYLLCLLIISTSEPRAPMQNGLSFTYIPLLWGRCFLLTLITGAEYNSPVHERLPLVESKTGSPLSFGSWVADYSQMTRCMERWLRACCSCLSSPSN